MTSFSQHLCHPLLFHSISIFAGAEDLNVNNIHSFKRSEPRWWYRVSRSFQQIDVSNKILMITSRSTSIMVMRLPMAYGKGFWETWQIQTEIQIKIQIQIMVMRLPMAYDRWFGETPLVWQTGATLAVGRMRILLQQFIMIILMLIRIILPTNVTYNLHLNFCFWKHVAILPKAWPPRFLSPPECCLSFFGMSLFLLNLSFCAILAMFPISNFCPMIKHENCGVCNQRAFKTSLYHRTYVEIQEANHK